MGIVACQAAYDHGEAWLDELVAYLAATRDAMAQFIRDRSISMARTEGTYLAWLDFRAMGLGDDAVGELVTRAGLWLSEGSQFGAGGAGHQRFNFARPRATVMAALRRLEAEAADS
jgi:cystathionine beta-lyase